MRRSRAALLLVLLCVCAELGPALGVREKKYYDALGVAPDADEATIKKAYRKTSAVSFVPAFSMSVQHYATAADDKFRKHPGGEVHNQTF